MKSIALIFATILVIAIIMYKPPFIINSVESVVLSVRSLALKYTYPKYFHNDPEHYQALPFEEVLKNSSTNVEKGEDKWVITTSYSGDSRPTQILLINKYDPNKPTLIYHHGAGSTTPLRDFNIILG